MTQSKNNRAPAPTSRSGRFASGPAADVAQFSESISFDWRLWKQDIQGSIAHAAMLTRIGILTPAENNSIAKGLNAIADQIAAGQFEWKMELEDVHMNIETALTQICPAGAKLHTARSRNDQVALDMRLWVRDAIDRLSESIRRLQSALVALAGKNATVWIPGYTHLQRAQPVSFAHHLLAYVEMLERDLGRFTDARKRANVCPLGSGAIAGSTLPLDRAFVACQLGFTDAKGRPLITENSMDAVSDRDFAIEFCSASALLAVHLSRLAEDIILWVSSEFAFIRISDAYTTGSSLMPQKKNPDIAELTRGKSGRVVGNLMALLTLLKGLPMTYNRDLQEDKERLFDTADTVQATVDICTGMFAHIQVLPKNCIQTASDPALLATDLADYLVQRGLPFRQAHHAVGAVVALAEKLGKPLNQITLDEYQSISTEFQPDVVRIFDLENAMKRRTVPGSPGPQLIRKQLARWEKLLSSAAASKRSAKNP